MAERFDYIIVGAGSAGCVLANRLSEDPDTRVLLLEAGPTGRSPFIEMPLGYAMTLKSRRYNWHFPTQADPGTNERDHLWPRGRALGGSSAINAMIYIRGNPADYDDWAALGARGWSAAEVLPYFLRAEDYEHGDRPGHGAGGPLPVREPGYIHPLSETLLEASDQAGLARRGDFNLGAQDGMGLSPVTIANGRRASAAHCYLKPARDRTNLAIRTRARVHRVLIEGRCASGAAYERNGRLCSAIAEREVILCGGTVNSPQLLELSGIGDPARLNALGIDVVAELPGVGANLQDHYNAALAWRLFPGTPSINTQARGFSLLSALWRYLRRRDGPMAVGPAHITGFMAAREDADRPGIQFHATPASLDAEAYRKNELVFHAEPGITIGASVLHPQGRGSVHAVSPDARRYPSIQTRYLAGEEDAAAMIAGLKMTRRIMAQPAIAPLVAAERSPGAEAASESELLAFARASGTTIYHPVGTCAMGARDDRQAVVGPNLAVRGVDGLRVADASIIPRALTGNTNAAAIMIGEKAADLIRGKRPPEPQPWPARRRPAASAAD